MTGGQMTVGAVVPVLERTIELPDMVAYAGATWDWHRLHYDQGYLAAKGLDRPVVDGQVFGALLAEQIQDWLGGRAFIQKMHFRFKSLVFAGETVKCIASVTEIERNDDGSVLLTIESKVEVVPVNDSDPTPRRVAVAPAGAVVRWQP